jgi:hypothetical protein
VSTLLFLSNDSRIWANRCNGVIISFAFLL